MLQDVAWKGETSLLTLSPLSHPYSSWPKTAWSEKTGQWGRSIVFGMGSAKEILPEEAMPNLKIER